LTWAAPIKSSPRYQIQEASFLAGLRRFWIVVNVRRLGICLRQMKVVDLGGPDQIQPPLPNSEGQLFSWPSSFLGSGKCQEGGDLPAADEGR